MLFANVTTGLEVWVRVRSCLQWVSRIHSCGLCWWRRLDPPPSIPHLPLVFHNPHAQSGTRPRLFLSCSSDRWRRIAKIKAKWRSCHPVSLVRLRMPRPNPLTMLSRCFWFGWVYLSQKRTGWPLKKHKKPNQRVLTAHINMIRRWYIQTIPKPSSLFSKCTFQPNLKKISYLECCHPYA